MTHLQILEHALSICLRRDLKSGPAVGLLCLHLHIHGDVTTAEDFADLLVTVDEGMLGAFQ